MATYRCPICETKIKLSEETKIGDRVTCTNCSAQLQLTLDGARKRLRCAFCTKDLVECGPDCETRILEKQKRGFFDITLN
ncbi:hypothetical protein A2276_02220 [candidate division WOR-1 bacterium RIFOXYA12_FULL_43_27]|nr:MAG: hypothetical protein A2276_02220 [candidate division WOR-1 bacterium RIFOXYA12_FULL_43_27]OGC19465.1 MAG: hypothetical protein A2292_02110 [candidate division WOR-1 bacterium RIFOXYB2_FULL_46_45]OGC30453.1 MAG: hypothetical protein A2232_02110 [candidate division WOR-1 bacterium RIFOXYA2_FULL_46_56]